MRAVNLKFQSLQAPSNHSDSLVYLANPFEKLYLDFTSVVAGQP